MTKHSVLFDFIFVQKHLFGVYNHCEPDMGSSKELSDNIYKKTRLFGNSAALVLLYLWPILEDLKTDK